MRRSPLIPILLALLVAVGAGAAWWFLAGPATRPADPVVVEEEQQRPQESATEQAADEVAPEPALACVRDDVAATLQAEAPTVEDLRALIGLCRAAGDLDLEVRLLERLSSMGDAEALRRFATWYDPRDTVEARPFGEPDAANAASYYKRAIEAGSAEAADDLSALCTHLRGAGDTAARMVIAIHCE